jgi:NAD(P)-dependent dehydrogenase (short-subunit alcohol dehydrogenase family)
MSAALAAELLEHNIAVNTLAPVSAVITPGVEMLGIDQSDPNFRAEPVEAMAEAALALCSEPAAMRTGETTYSVEFLRRIGRVVRNLDGRGEVNID